MRVSEVSKSLRDGGEADARCRSCRRSCGSKRAVSLLLCTILAQPHSRHVVQEFGQRLYRVALDVVELVDELLGGLLGDGARRDGRRFVGEEVAVIGCRELHAEVCSAVERLGVSGTASEERRGGNEPSSDSH